MFVKRILFPLLVFLCLPSVSEGQKILAVDSYKFFGFHRLRYSVGDQISFKLYDLKKIYTGDILEINDSTIVIKGMEVPLKQIRSVYVDKGNFLTKGLSKFLIWGGLGFIILDTGNNLINKESEVVKERALIPGAAIMAGGFLLNHMAVKKYRIGRRNSLKVMDVSGG